jgi:hypothetical protein
VTAAECNARCGTIAGIECPAGQFCDLEPGLCGGADIAGTCTLVPQSCLKNIDPVCGCNGTTYPTDCVRRTQMVQKAHDGRCSRPRTY